jgi:regulator of protease activity HflC (stomatin/prohibitin superfamily)
MRRENKILFAIVATIILLAVVLAMFFASFINVPAGHVAVVTSAPSKNDIGTVYGEGWHFKLGFMFMDIEIMRYNTQTVEFSVITEETTGRMSNYGPVNVRSSDNLEVYLDFSITYEMNKEDMGKIRLKYGDYKTTVLEQVARSVPRDVCSEYMALTMAGPMRMQVEEQIGNTVRAQLESHFIHMVMFSLREIQLPDEVDAAVQAKKVAEQDLITSGYIAEQQIVLATGAASALIIAAEAEANATVLNAIGDAEAINLIYEMLLANDPDATVDAYLTYLFIQALTDPTTNIEYVILYDGEGTPFIIDVGTVAEPVPEA